MSKASGVLSDEGSASYTDILADCLYMLIPMLTLCSDVLFVESPGFAESSVFSSQLVVSYGVLVLTE
jgi:hypothetical protein